MDLSIMCVTKAEPFAIPFLQQMATLASNLDAELIVGLDGAWDDDHPTEVLGRWFDLGLPCIGGVFAVQSQGYLESVHDDLLRYCSGRYVLRLDDDERVSESMAAWLAFGEYRAEPHWKFPRAHLWGSPDRYIVNSPLWPDHQTRLSVREMAGGRTSIHCGSPFGGGAEAPVVIQHHKFLVKPLEERRAIVERYNRIQPGAGDAFLAFSVPEDYYAGDKGGIVTAPYDSQKSMTWNDQRFAPYDDRVERKW